MYKNCSRGVAVLERVLSNPSLLPEVWSKLQSRFTDKRHQKRANGYTRLVVPPVEGLADLLEVEPDVIRRCMKSESLGRLMTELEAYEVPAEGAGMGGAGFLEVCYAIIRLTRPKVVLETGVARGYSTSVILQALEDNGQGKVYSVDLPAFRPGMVSHTGGAVPERLKSPSSWELKLGPDRQVLPSLLERMGSVDCFIYDSDKSYEGMIHTWKRVWPYLKPGAVLMLDDIHAHDAFLDFADSVGLRPVVVSKPVNQGVYRWNKAYYVGLLRKPGAT